MEKISREKKKVWSEKQQIQSQEKNLNRANADDADDQDDDDDDDDYDGNASDANDASEEGKAAVNWLTPHFFQNSGTCNMQLVLLIKATALAGNRCSCFA